MLKRVPLWIVPIIRILLEEREQLLSHLKLQFATQLNSFVSGCGLGTRLIGTYALSGALCSTSAFLVLCTSSFESKYLDVVVSLSLELW